MNTSIPLLQAEFHQHSHAHVTARLNVSVNGITNPRKIKTYLFSFGVCLFVSFSFLLPTPRSFKSQVWKKKKKHCILTPPIKSEFMKAWDLKSKNTPGCFNISCWIYMLFHILFCNIQKEHRNTGEINSATNISSSSWTYLPVHWQPASACKEIMEETEPSPSHWCMAGEWGAVGVIWNKRGSGWL